LASNDEIILRSISDNIISSPILPQLNIIFALSLFTIDAKKD